MFNKTLINALGYPEKDFQKYFLRNAWPNIDIRNKSTKINTVKQLGILLKMLQGRSNSEIHQNKKFLNIVHQVQTRNNEIIQLKLDYNYSQGIVVWESNRITFYSIQIFEKIPKNTQKLTLLNNPHSEMNPSEPSEHSSIYQQNLKIYAEEAKRFCKRIHFQQKSQP